MKDITRKELEADRPLIHPAKAVEYCLRQLYRDKTHRVTDEICSGLSYEELIGALLLAQDCIEEG